MRLDDTHAWHPAGALEDLAPFALPLAGLLIAALLILI